MEILRRKNRADRSIVETLYLFQHENVGQDDSFLHFVVLGVLVRLLEPVDALRVQSGLECVSESS